MLVTGCEKCEKQWEECCGKGLSEEEINRINKAVEASVDGPTVETDIC